MPRTRFGLKTDASKPFGFVESSGLTVAPKSRREFRNGDSFGLACGEFACQLPSEQDSLDALLKRATLSSHHRQSSVDCRANQAFIW